MKSLIYTPTRPNGSKWKRTIPLWRAKVAEYGDEKGVSSGLEQNVNAIIVPHAENHFTEVHSIVELAKGRLPRN